MIFRILFLMLFAVNVFAAPPSECDGVTCIELTWSTPTEREDGSLIEVIDRYDINFSIEGVDQPIIPVDSVNNSYYLIDVSPDDYVFKIRTVENGLVGRYSSPVSTNVISRPRWPSMSVNVLVTFSVEP